MTHPIRTYNRRRLRAARHAAEAKFLAGLWPYQRAVGRAALKTWRNGPGAPLFRMWATSTDERTAHLAGLGEARGHVGPPRDLGRFNCRGGYVWPKGEDQ